MPGKRAEVPETTWPRHLPTAKRILAIVAHPGEESTYLGGVLRLYRDAGAQFAVFCLTRGETCSSNVSMRRDTDAHLAEFVDATDVLGADDIMLADHPDGRLESVPVEELADRVRRFADAYGADLMLVVDGVTADGNSDIATTAQAACRAATADFGTKIPVVAWTFPSHLPPGHGVRARRPWSGRPRERIDLVVEVSEEPRRVQLAALGAYGSWEAPDRLRHEARLRVQGAREWLRWLVR